MSPLSKISSATVPSIGLVVVAASLALPAKMQAGAFTAGLIPMATIAEVDRSANPLDLPDASQLHEIASAETGNSAGGNGFRMGSNQQRMLISGHDGSASGGDIAGALSFRRRAVQRGAGGTGAGGGSGAGSGGSASSGTNPPITSAGPIISNHNGPTSGPPVFHNPPVTPGDAFNPPQQQGGDSFVPSGTSKNDIVGPDSNSPSNFPDTTTANVTESPLSFPEPGSMALLSVGIAGLLVWRRRGKLRPS
jgi:hypothetical protein